MHGLAGGVGLFHGGQVGGGCDGAEHHARVAQVVFIEVFVGLAAAINVIIPFGQYAALIVVDELINSTLWYS